MRHNMGLSQNSIKLWKRTLLLTVMGTLGLLTVINNLAIGQQAVTQNPDLIEFQQKRTGIVKPSFGLSPISGLREGEMLVEGKPIIVELALDSAAQAKGLMYRESMPEDRGMLFMFPTTQPLAFWMKNTLIPLDIIYIAEDGAIVDIVTAEPCQTIYCHSYPSKMPGKYVLELNAGMAERLGLEVGTNLNRKWN